MSIQLKEVPLGIRCLQKVTDTCCHRLHFKRDLYYRISVLFLTYVAYMCYHMSRKPISVVKAVLHQNCSQFKPPDNLEPSEKNTWCDWAPFNGTDASASQLLGELDSAFLFSYAAAMFVSGFIAERVNLRYFLALGMLFSGLFSYLFGIAKSYDIHHIGYYVVVQIFAGIFQTTGWPGVVTVVSNWFGKGKRGLIFGIWNSHTSIGNILGSLIAAVYVESDWALSFIMPGLIIGVTGMLIFLFLVVHPTDVGCSPPDNQTTQNKRQYRRLENAVANVGEPPSDYSSDADDTPIVIGEQALVLHRTPLVAPTDDTEVQRRATERTYLLPHEGKPHQAIGFFGAFKIPGVVEYSLSLFFSKLVSYTFLYWLPLYVNASTEMSPTLSADLSTLFDVGGILGAIAAGVISDYSGMSATTCVGMLAVAAPLMFTYQHFSSINLGVNMVLLFFVGILVNGPYALITTAVSAELGTHSSLEGNSKALATVTAIIDGTGSIGAAVGPFLAGFVSNLGWHYVFAMLIVSDMLALLLLLRLVKHELQSCRQRRRIRIE